MKRLVLDLEAACGWHGVSNECQMTKLSMAGEPEPGHKDLTVPGIFSWTFCVGFESQGLPCACCRDAPIPAQ